MLQHVNLDPLSLDSNARVSKQPLCKTQQSFQPIIVLKNCIEGSLTTQHT
jgi:hypothetical protein